MLRSYNRGATWDSLSVASAVTVNGISFVNKDTGWVGGPSGAVPFLWKTTNAGLKWTVNLITQDGKVFFLKNKVNGEYMGWSMNYTSMWKTTNSGVTGRGFNLHLGFPKCILIRRKHWMGCNCKYCEKRLQMAG